MRIEEIAGVRPFEAFEALRDMPLPFIFSWETEPGSRLCYVGADPFITIKTMGAETAVCADGARAGSYGDPFTALSEIMAGLSTPERGPFPFNSGVAGYFSYDLKAVTAVTARRTLQNPDFTAQGLGLPECVAGVYDPVFVYDCSRAKGYLVSRGDKPARYAELSRAINGAKGEMAGGRPLVIEPGAAFSSNVTRDDYISAIRRAQRYIEAGDIYQVNLSHRLQTQWEGDPYGLFKAIVRARASRFSSYMDMGEFQIISNSPERLLCVRGRTVETSPIKGTRPRGATPEEDERLIRELKRSEKERAEHVMIVDLERNDIGRISEPGTVEVAEFEAIKTYPGLHHMVSTVRGRLREGLSAVAALGSVFPGGSVTGAPKARAIEVIDELERAPRGVYTGGIGLIDLGGDMDASMAIRTAVSKNGLLYLSVGGGIVADSVPEEEYTETIVKADDFLMALGRGRAQGAPYHGKASL